MRFRLRVSVCCLLTREDARLKTVLWLVITAGRLGPLWSTSYLTCLIWFCFFSFTTCEFIPILLGKFSLHFTFSVQAIIMFWRYSW